MSIISLEKQLNDALRTLGLPAVDLKDSGMAEAELRGLRIGLEYSERTQCLILYCSLGSLPFETSGTLYDFLLETSLMGMGTGGGHIGLYAPTRTLIFSLSLPEEHLISHHLANALERFAEKAVELIAAVEEKGFVSMDAGSAAFMGNVLWA